MEEKIWVTVLGLLLLGSTLVFHEFSSKENLNTDRSLKIQFQNWLLQHGKTYPNQDYIYRLSVFAKTLEQNAKHNEQYKRGEQSYFVGLNQFSDLTLQEFREIYLQKEDQLVHADYQCTGAQARNKTTDNWDWVAKGAVTPVREQKSCVAGWAMAASGAVEAAMFLTSGRMTPLSSQQIIDCSVSDKACEGGKITNAFGYLIKVGSSREINYPYKGTSGTCYYQLALKYWDVYKCTSVTGHSEEILRSAVVQQPVASFMDASSSGFKNYRGGVFGKSGGLFPKSPCENKQNHGVLIVGFGHDSSDKKDYWMVKNSMGTDWGIKGYMKLERVQKDTSQGMCGVQTMPSFAIG